MLYFYCISINDFYIIKQLTLSYKISKFLQKFCLVFCYCLLPDESILIGTGFNFCTINKNGLSGNFPHAKNGLDACVIEACKPFYPPQLIIQDELHLISGPLGTIYGGYETIIEDMCCLEKNGKKIHPKYVVSTATIKNAREQIKCLYARENYAQFLPSGFDTRDAYFIREIPFVSKDLEDLTEDDITELLEKGEKPFRQYAGICASGQSVKTTLIRLYSVLLQEAFILSEDPKYQDYVDPYYTLVGYFNSIRELGGAVRLLDDDINSRLKVLRKKYKNARQRFLGFDGKKEITSRIPSYQIAEILEKLAEPFDPSKERQSCYDVVIATNMIAVGMDVDRLGLMAVVGQPKQNSEYIQATNNTIETTKIAVETGILVNISFSPYYSLCIF